MATKQLEFGAADLDWARVYKALGMKFEQSDLMVDPDPNFWDVYVLKGVTVNKIVKVLRGLGVEMLLGTDDLGRDTKNLKRDPKKGSYRVRFKKTVEADPDLAEKSAEDLYAAGIDGITLVERLLLELWYFMATGKHLDVENSTLCAGSQIFDGFTLVPTVHWSEHALQLQVDPTLINGRELTTRARAVVS